MDIKKIKGNSYYIDAPTNIGVYSFKNKNCIVFDTGINSSAAKKLDDIFVSSSLVPKHIINSHCHMDHCGGNAYFKNNYTGALLYSSYAEKLFIENEDLYPAQLCSCEPSRLLSKLKSPHIDFILDPGMVKINDEKFEIFSLPGHSSGQIGLLTPDKVCFTGDAVFSREIIDKYSIPNLYSVKNSLKTLDTLKSIDADYFVVGHSDRIYDKSDMIELCNYNIDNINKYSDLVLELLNEPLSRENILENIAVLNDINLDYKEYYLCISTVSAFINYHYELGVVDFSVENGNLYYFKKS